MSFIAVYITHSSEIEAKKVANYLLAEKLIACVNYFPINSSYWWKENLYEDAEYVSLVKTTNNLWDRLIEVIEKIHPYEVPCIIKYEVSANKAYEEWIYESVLKSEI